MHITTMRMVSTTRISRYWLPDHSFANDMNLNSGQGLEVAAEIPTDPAMYQLWMKRLQATLDQDLEKCMDQDSRINPWSSRWDIDIAWAYEIDLNNEVFHSMP
jgi:hypothetical protein